jgi:hypothetical protein
MKKSQNKLQNSGTFLDAKKAPSTHHHLPRNHHTFTTKSPHQNTPFPQNPVKNGPSTQNKKSS